MKKLKSVLALFTAILFGLSFCFSSSAGALSVQEIQAEIEKLNYKYEDSQGVHRAALKDHPGWLELFTDVLYYAGATEGDVKISPQPQDMGQNWADWIAREDGFLLESGEVDEADRANIARMLENFGHNEGYFQSGWRVKKDYKLLLDWGALYYTVENRAGETKPYRVIIFDTDDDQEDPNYASFGDKIREIYNLDPEQNATRRDMLCLRSVFRAIAALDGDVDQSHLREMIARFFGSGASEKLIKLVANDAQTKAEIGLVMQDFTQGVIDPVEGSRNLRYRSISRFLISAYYGMGLKAMESPTRELMTKDGLDYVVSYSATGYVEKIEPLVSNPTPATPAVPEGDSNSNNPNPGQEENPNANNENPGPGENPDANNENPGPGENPDANNENPGQEGNPDANNNQNPGPEGNPDANNNQNPGQEGNPDANNNQNPGPEGNPDANNNQNPGPEGNPDANNNQNSDPKKITPEPDSALKENKESKSNQNLAGGGSSSKNSKSLASLLGGYGDDDLEDAIRETGLGVNHLALLVGASVAGLSGVAGLIYIVVKKKKKHVK